MSENTQFGGFTWHGFVWLFSNKCCCLSNVISVGQKLVGKLLPMPIRAYLKALAFWSI